MFRAIRQCDLKLLMLLLSLHRFSRLEGLARAVSRTGDGWLYLLIMPLCIVLLKPEHTPELVAIALFGFSLERILYYVLKNLLRRPRPEQALANFKACITPSDRFSMPSGHTSAAFFVASFLSFGLSLAFFPLYLWALCVGLSRMALGVHFPSDLAGGAILGTSIALLLL